MSLGEEYLLTINTVSEVYVDAEGPKITADDFLDLE
jgi:hypothetical protein